MAAAHTWTWDKWHWTLRHIHHDAIKNIFKSGLVTGMEVDKTKSPTQCMACIQGKHHVMPYLAEASQQDFDCGEVAMSDVWGPMQTEGMSPEIYYYTDIKT